MEISSHAHKKNFFQYVFNFDDHSKSEILNIFQYALLALIPIVILNKSLQRYVPEADDKKGSLELSAEIIIQTIVMFLGLLLIHRMVSYVPTYSGVDYPDFYIHFVILAVLMISLSLQTKIGEKASILSERVYDLWNGKPDKKSKKNSANNNNNGTSMLPRNPMSTGMSSQGPIDRSSTTSIGSLPNPAELAMMSSPEQMTNYNNMYQNNSTPLVNAASPEGMQGMMMEPMPANALGGSAFGSW